MPRSGCPLAWFPLKNEKRRSVPGHSPWLPEVHPLADSPRGGPSVHEYPWSLSVSSSLPIKMPVSYLFHLSWEHTGVKMLRGSGSSHPCPGLAAPLHVLRWFGRAQPYTPAQVYRASWLMLQPLGKFPSPWPVVCGLDRRPWWGELISLHPSCRSVSPSKILTKDHKPLLHKVFVLSHPWFLYMFKG